MGEVTWGELLPLCAGPQVRAGGAQGPSTLMLCAPSHTHAPLSPQRGLSRRLRVTERQQAQLTGCPPWGGWGQLRLLGQGNEDSCHLVSAGLEQSCVRRALPAELR